MNIRQMQEKIEKEVLSTYASLSMNSKGREREEELCDMRTVYQRDRDRIIHSKAFRRLMYKTQVFLMPKGDHYRNRMVHSLEVKQIAVSIATALRLNRDLTEAIALGHDLGHTPFGHTGERALNKIASFEFKHSEQGIRVVKYIEKNGLGLNLTEEVLDGILNHSTSGNPSTLEGKVVRISDKIAYINHDIEDSIRAKILKEEDLPEDCIIALGKTKDERITTMIKDVVVNSLDKPDIKMSDFILEKTYKLRKFMYDRVYIGSPAKVEDCKAEDLIKRLYKYYINNVDEVKKQFNLMDDNYKANDERMIIDYIAGMTDRYAIDEFKRIYVPLPWDII